MPARPLEDQDDDSNRLLANVDEVVEEASDEPVPVKPRPAAAAVVNPRRTRRAVAPKPEGDSDGPGTATIYVSDGVYRRLDEFRRKKQGRTNRDVILTAISENRAQLKEIIEASKINTGSVGDLFPADPRNVRFCGGGKVPLQFTPTAEQAEVLDRLTEDLGFATRSTWIAPVLNAALPGKKETP